MSLGFQLPVPEQQGVNDLLPPPRRRHTGSCQHPSVYLPPTLNPSLRPLVHLRQINGPNSPQGCLFMSKALLNVVKLR